MESRGAPVMWVSLLDLGLVAPLVSSSCPARVPLVRRWLASDAASSETDGELNDVVVGVIARWKPPSSRI